MIALTTLFISSSAYAKMCSNEHVMSRLEVCECANRTYVKCFSDVCTKQYISNSCDGNRMNALPGGKISMNGVVFLYDPTPVKVIEMESKKFFLNQYRKVSAN